MTWMKFMGHGRIILTIQTGEVTLFLQDIQALVKHLPHRANYNLDIHTPSGMFTIVDFDDRNYDEFEKLWVNWRTSN